MGLLRKEPQSSRNIWHLVHERERGGRSRFQSSLSEAESVMEFKSHLALGALINEHREPDGRLLPHLLTICTAVETLLKIRICSQAV